MSGETAAEWKPELDVAGDTAELVGDWWITYDEDRNPLRMDWAGGRESTVPLAAFVWVAP